MIVEMTKRMKEIYDTAIITRLGEDLKQTGNLIPEAMERTLNVLRDYKTIATKSSVREIICVGTAALREAYNKDTFLKLAKKELSLDIRVISEREEALYTYLSVRQNLLDNIEGVVIIDIGGGSTEITYGDRENFIDYISLPIGSVKLTEMFIKSDPPSYEEIILMRDFIKSTLKLSFKKNIQSVIGTAGTITTLGSIAIGLQEWDKKQIHGLKLKRERIDEISQYLLAKSISERSTLPGMEKGREDIIPQGIILLQEILKYFGADELTIDANGVRHGILCDRFAFFNARHDLS
jgi:exopolyphosphatase/guanosine-5'-triphosphate,3'-diphosphate pyrophosphatase